MPLYYFSEKLRERYNDRKYLGMYDILLLEHKPMSIGASILLSYQQHNDTSNNILTVCLVQIPWWRC